ncbi:MAG: dihydroorotase, partial [Oscillospiraceae bacterium]|nr:dihydroorotase [Oscillospiraceae bacterium]
VDMIATDHAPHSAEEKSKGLEKSAMGIVGLEAAFAAMYTHFVKPGIIGWDKLIELMCTAPRKRFGIPAGNDFTVVELSEMYYLEPESFQGKGRATPFEGAELYGKCVLTVHDDKIVWNKL